MALALNPNGSGIPGLDEAPRKSSPVLIAGLGVSAAAHLMGRDHKRGNHFLAALAVGAETAWRESEAGAARQGTGSPCCWRSPPPPRARTHPPPTRSLQKSDTAQPPMPRHPTTQLT